MPPHDGTGRPDVQDLPDLLHLYFDRQARTTPDAVALRFGGTPTTYGELGRRADAVAAALAARELGPGALVGLHMERSPDQVAAALGILEAGGAVVPLPPTDPEQRRREVSSFGELDAVIVEDAADVDVGGAARVVAMRGLEAPASPPRPPEVDPAQPAFVLTSSGSTGRPKMIARSHRSFFHRLRWTWSRHPFAPGELGCQKAHTTTTHSLYELFEPLLAGTPTLVVPDEVARDLEVFWDTLRDEGVTRLLLVPSVLRASLEMPGFAPPPLRVVVFMGEYLAPELAAEAVRVFDAGTSLYSIYGSTEASSTLVVDLREAARPDRPLPLGTPITDDVRALVLDDEHAEVPPGGEGRLYMAGTPLFSGYWRDPEQTARVLVDLPGRDGPLYDTRDRVHLAEDGSLHFRGRVDHVVKVRGFRVDLGEVERTMLAAPDVRQAAVVVAHEGTAQAALVGFYAPEGVDADGLWRRLRDALPPHMVPSSLASRADFPRTTSAKVDRMRLLEDFLAQLPEPQDDGSLSGTEAEVAEVWRATLGHDRFGPGNSFFEVGGTSLTAFSLVHRLRGKFGLDREQLPEEALYRHPDVRQMAAHVEALKSGRAGAGEATPLLVTLRGAKDGAADEPPLFMVASAGGTLGAYAKLASTLATKRAILGVRDPFVWGDRDPRDGFRRWLDRYEEAVRERQPEGPYHVCAYSSAGAFGYELARRLRAGGHEVALLALVDPLAMDRASPRRFGYWALRAVWLRRELRVLVRLFGRARAPFVRLLNALGSSGANVPDRAFSPEEIEQISRRTLENPGHLRTVAGLLELNTGLPFTLDENAFDGLEPREYIGVLRDRVTEVTPDVDPETIERIVVQYEEQILSQHAYRLSPLDARVLLVEPVSPHAGLSASLVRPYVKELIARRVPLGPMSPREVAASRSFGNLMSHYRSMRDDTFVQGLAREMDRLL